MPNQEIKKYSKRWCRGGIVLVPKESGENHCKDKCRHLLSLVIIDYSSNTSSNNTWLKLGNQRKTLMVKIWEGAHLINLEVVVNRPSMDATTQTYSNNNYRQYQNSSSFKINTRIMEDWRILNPRCKRPRVARRIPAITSRWSWWCQTSWPNAKAIKRDQDRARSLQANREEGDPITQIRTTTKTTFTSEYHLNT
jgi:hypothetical protein